MVQPFGERRRRERARLLVRDNLGDPFSRGQEGCTRGRLRDGESVLGNDHPLGMRRSERFGSEQHFCDAGEEMRRTGEPTDRIETRRLRHHAVERQPSVRRANPENPAEARRDPDRSAGVGAQCEIDQISSDCSRGAAR